MAVFVCEVQFFHSSESAAAVDYSLLKDEVAFLCEKIHVPDFSLIGCLYAVGSFVAFGAVACFMDSLEPKDYRILLLILFYSTKLKPLEGEYLLQ